MTFYQHFVNEGLPFTILQSLNNRMLFNRNMRVFGFLQFRHPHGYLHFAKHSAIAKILWVAAKIAKFYSNDDFFTSLTYVRAEGCCSTYCCSIMI